MAMKLKCIVDEQKSFDVLWLLAWTTKDFFQRPRVYLRPSIIKPVLLSSHGQTC